MDVENKTDIDKGSIDSEALIEIYADLGLYLMYDDKPEDSVEKFQEKYGEIRNELVYLRSREAVTLDDNIEKISLKSSDRNIAHRIANEIHNEKNHPDEVVDLSWVPEYLSSPEMKEEQSEPVKNLDQRPSDKVPTRVFEALSSDEPLYPSEVEEEFAAETTFDLEPWMKYLETQGAVEKVEPGGYRLVEGNISDRFFGEKLNTEGRIKDHERYGNDPWKP